MANTVGTLVKEIFGLVGIDANQPEFKDIVALATPLDDATYEKVSKNILTIDAAKMNGVLKSHFKAQTLNGVDAQHKELATEYGLTADEVAELDAIKDTFDRNKKLIAKVKANTEKINAGKGDTAKLVAENQRLNAEIVAIKAATDQQIAQLKASTESQISDFAIMSHLRGLKYANDKVDADVNALTAKQILNAALAEKKAGVKRTAENTLKLYQLDNPELDYLENHKPISFADLAARELQAKNMLAITAPNGASGNNGKPIANGGNGADGKAPDNSEAIKIGRAHV